MIEKLRFLIVGGVNFLFTLPMYDLLLVVVQPIILALHFLVSRLGTAYAAAYWRYMAAAREKLALVRRDESGHIANQPAGAQNPVSTYPAALSRVVHSRRMA